MVQDLLGELSRRGIRLRLVDGRLDVVAPTGALTAELREQLAARRDELANLLRRVELTTDPVSIEPDPAGRHEPFALTDIQHAYWIGRHRAVHLGGVSTHYYFELEGAELEPDRLAHSLRRVIDRHDMLRAVIDPDGRQRVLPEVPAYDLAVADLRGRSLDEQAAVRERLRDEMAHRAPDADRWPLFDIRLCRLDETVGSGRSRLHVSVNMLILDAGSLELLFSDWSRWYTDPEWTPEPLPLTYRDYVLAVENLRARGRYRADEEYWSRRIDSLPPAPALPLATWPGALTEVVFTGRAGRLDERRWNAVKQIARRHGLTPSVVLMTAFADVLRAWSRQPGFTLNLTLFHRPALHPELDRIIGDFTSLTMLAVDAEAREPFAVRAQRMQAQLAEDLEHAGHSGVRVLQERTRRLGGQPDAAMPVVFTSALRSGSGPTSAAAGHGRRFFGRLVYSLSQTPQVWLDHQVTEESGTLLFNWDAVEALFPAGLLDDAFEAFRRVLVRLSEDEQAWTDPRTPVDLPDWQARRRAEVNDTAADLPARTLAELVLAKAGRRPDAVAVIAPDRRCSYGEVVRDAHRLAHRLSALGATAGTLVAVLLDKSWQQVPAVLGIVLSRAAYLPIDPQWPPARRDEVLSMGGVSIVVTSACYREQFTWPVGVTTVALDDDEVAGASDAALAEAPTPADLAYVIFTSGSTGTPKGVMIDHRGAANTIQDVNQRFAVGPDDRVLALSALTFDLSVYDIFGVLAAGGTIVIPTDPGQRDPAEWTDLIRRHEVTVWNSVPALMQAWLGARPPSTALRLVLLSGDWVPVSLPDAVRETHPAAAVVSLGGATEASIWSVCYPVGTVAKDWTSIPYGRPMANQNLYVYDQWQRPSPVWTAGEIYIGGVGLAKGYWADPERTAQRFVIHPDTGERLYRTGDLGRYLPDGDIEFLGRQDFQVKLNGYRIELGEISAALRRCRGVAEALVDVATNPTTGRGQLVAYVVARTEPTAAYPALGAQTEAPWSAVVAAANAELDRGRLELAGELSTLERWWRQVDALCPAIIARTLADIGAFTSPGEVADADDIIRRHGVKPQYVGLIGQWLETLAATGSLTATTDGSYRCDAGLDVDALNGHVRRGLAAIEATGPHRVFVDYLIGCAESQVDLLRGGVSPLQLLLPEGRAEVPDAIYAGNPSSRLQNEIAAALVSTAAGMADRNMSIVEIGAGTGATTAAILSKLPRDGVTYRFTDVSSYFTAAARRRFTDHPNLTYARYDIDQEPAGQGIAPGSVDIVVAANVLHDAQDLPRSLGYLRDLLASGGLLVVIEGTANTRIQLISFGFVEGFGNHEGKRALPLLSVPEWAQELKAAGFVRLTSVPHGPAVTEAMGQHVLVAQAPSRSDSVDAARLRATLAETLPSYLVPRHYLLLDRLPLTGNGKVDRAALPQPWDSGTAPEPVEAHDDFERTLLVIWRQTLDRDDFGVEDDFFELGGDSMHAVGMLSRLRDELGVRQTADEALQALFENPTVARLAAALRTRP